MSVKNKTEPQESRELRSDLRSGIVLFSEWNAALANFFNSPARMYIRTGGLEFLVLLFQDKSTTMVMIHQAF